MELWNTISLEVFSTILEKNAPLIIDVRSEREYKSFHLQGAVNTPLASLTPASLVSLQQRMNAQGKPVYILCRSGVRAKKAAQTLAEDSKLSGYIVEGGTIACDKYGMHIISNSSLTSYNSRVRAVIAALVFFGVFFSAALIYLA